ncbi:MAG TPA: amino acid ABC transporter substrate-binding protein [Gammaproteobacteria bacterium]|nr:amino acid ABC transporter substrate-binding protein [Gammaproteobacteria bacterium]
MKRSNALLLVSALLLTYGSHARAADGTLAKIAKRGELRIGYDKDSEPMSFVDKDGSPAGYSVDLCRRIASAVKTELKREDLKVTYVAVDFDGDFRAMVKGDIDLECGSTTITLDRYKLIDFSVMTFVTGGSFVSRGTQPVNTVADLAGKSVAVIPGTTTETALKRQLKDGLIDAKIVSVKDHVEGMTKLDAGQVAALASDQMLLIGQLMKSKNPKNYALSNDLYSYEPYGLVVPKDDAAFRLVVNRALVQMYRNSQYVDIYGRWIGSFGIKPSPVLVSMFAIQQFSD